MNVFDGGADEIVRRAKDDPMVRESVEMLRAIRCAADAESFERMLWLAVAQGVYLGARIVVELQAEALNHGNA
jgi:hypothetical protein